MPQLATITRSQFEQWVQGAFEVTKVPSVRAISKVSGISKSTLSYQLNADFIPAQNIIKISRGIGKPPRHELSQFRGLELYRQPMRSPADAELLALVPPGDVLVEGARRLGAVFLDWQPGVLRAGQDAWADWFKVAAPNVSSAALQEITGFSSPQVSKHQKEATWSIEHIALMSQTLGFDAVFALAVSGNLTYEEAGLSPDIAPATLANFADDELQKRTSTIAKSLANTIGRTKVSETTHAFLELG